MTIQATPAAADHPTRARVGAGNAVLNVSIFFAAFVLVCALVRLPSPLEEVPGVGPKYRFFAEHKADYNVLFLGSSRVFHHFLPKPFDERVARLTGEQLSSFNFGYDGMWPPESLYMLRKVLALRPPNLRWVLIDLVHVNPKIDAENMGTLRVEYWHDWQHTMMAWNALRGERLKFWNKVDLAVLHAQYLLKRFANLGRSSEWLDKKLRPPEKKGPKAPKWANTNGYEMGLDREMVGAELRRYEEQVDQYRKAPKAVLGPVTSKAIQDIAAEVRAAGAEPIFVLAPTLDRRENVTDLPGNLELFSFADPDKYPDLYDDAKHYDAWHLNEDGARVFTGHLADSFSAKVKALRSAGSPPQASK